MYKKPFRYVALALVFLLLLPVVALADGPISDNPVEVETLAPAPMPTPAPEVSVVLDPAVEGENAFSSAFSSLFGPYTPRTQTVVTTQADGTVVEVQEPLPGVAGLDWPWLARVTRRKKSPD